MNHSREQIVDLLGFETRSCAKASPQMETNEMAKNRIPKTIAGFKMPKPIRKSPVVRSLLGSATGRQILADALIAGAGAAAAVLAGTRSETVADAGASVAKGTAKAGNVAKDAVESATSAMANVIGDAARTILPGTTAKSGNADRRRTAPKTATAKASPARH